MATEKELENLMYLVKKTKREVLEGLLNWLDVNTFMKIRDEITRQLKSLEPEPPKGE